MTLSEKQLEEIQDETTKNTKEEDLKRVDSKELEDTPMEVYESRMPTGLVYIFDGDELVFKTSKVMNRDVIPHAISQARMYALGAGYRDEY